MDDNSISGKAEYVNLPLAFKGDSLLRFGENNNFWMTFCYIGHDLVVPFIYIYKIF